MAKSIRNDQDDVRTLPDVGCFSISKTATLNSKAGECDLAGAPESRQVANVDLYLPAFLFALHLR